MDICEEYDGVWYDNFDELQKDKPALAKELLDNIDQGAWQDDQLYVYATVEDYAYYELTEGWYASLNMNAQIDYHGAPDPLDFIDLKALGKRLAGTWDDSCYYKSSKGEVVSTGYGWNCKSWLISA